jgi:leader peptidase (prepilin peptidase)/N-methyltransferase
MVIALATVAAGLLCLLVPTLVGAVPEPTPRPVKEGQEPEPPKIPYAELAARNGLRLWAALTGALTGALLGWRLGADEWWLWVCVALVPVGAALAYIDWHTRLLPTRIVVPATLAVVVAGLVGWAVTGDPDDLVRALLGLLIGRSIYWVLWFIHSAGMGFGDVRLAALLGFTLAYLGWGEFAIGMYAGFLIFGLPGLALALVRWNRSLLKAAYPFGPFMLIGAVIGVLIGPWAWDRLVGG